MKKSLNRNSLLFFGSMILLFIYIWELRSIALSTLSTSIIPKNRDIANYAFYLFAFLFGLAAFFASKTRGTFIIFCFILIVSFAVLSFYDQSYSPVDESLHFDYINHLIKNKKLVTFDDSRDYAYLNLASNGSGIGEGVNYEAVQAPLYYLVMSLVGGFIQNAYWRLHIIRLISLLLVIPILFFLHSTMLDIDTDIRKNDAKIRMIRVTILATIMNPGYLYRASRVGNEIMVCLLISALLKIGIRCLKQGYQRKYYWWMGILSALCFLTKTTAIYSYAILGALAICQRKIGKAIICATISGLLVIPWLAFNMFQYGNLTAMKEHLNIVHMIANPQKAEIDLFEGFFSLIPYTWFTGEEMPTTQVEMCIEGIFYGMVILLTGFSSHKGIREYLKIYRMKSNNINDKSDNGKICLICSILIVSCLTVLCVGTISTKINSLRARYFYPVFPALIMSLIVAQKRIDFKWQTRYSVVLLIVISIANTRAFSTMTDRVFKQYDLYGSNISELQLADITDENWC